VVLDKDGQPSGVRYHALPAMLLNELQRQQRVIEMQAAQAREQARLIDELKARLSRLEAMGTAAAGR
jgi:predicted ribonuclease YlaK